MTHALPGLSALARDPMLRDVLGGERNWLLALDYDGTLAPFTPQRDEAFPYPEAASILRLLPMSGPNRVAVISGRDCESVSRLLGLDPMPEIWGCHGMQRMLPGGNVMTAELGAGQKKALRTAQNLVDDPDLLEVKPCSVALHWRGMPQAEQALLEAAVRPAWSSLALSAGLTLHAFDGGIELRPPGLDKGTAIRTLVMENPGSTVFFLGDDLTDEDGFMALGGRGVGVLVRPEPRPTAASYWIAPPAELVSFLAVFLPSGP